MDAALGARGIALAAALCAANTTYGQPPSPAAPAVGRSEPGLSPSETDSSSNAARPAPGGGNPGVPRTPPARIPAPPASPWKPLFFDNDFSPFVGKPPYAFGEEFKKLPLDLPGETFDVTLDVGGQLRHRYELHDDQIRPGDFVQNDFQLWRWRQYFDLKHDYVRLYVETIDASSVGEELPSLPPEVNRFDLLNAFFDVELYDNDDWGAGTLRYGRQELLYARQRTVSPLDWSNTRRNFEGVKFLHEDEGWRFDAWAVNPVNSVARGGIDMAEFDSSPDEADRRRTFYGAYLTLTANPKVSVDLYMLYQDDERPRTNFAEGDRGLNAARLYGQLPVDCDRRAWDYEFEGGYEWGSNLGRRVAAGFFTTEAGHTWKKLAWQPRFGGVFYYGSGDSNPADDTQETFYTWYPLGHAFWGISDNLSGQNLLDVGPQLSFNPTKKLNVTGAWLWFWKAREEDFLYNVAQAPVGPTNVGTDIGQEASLVGNYTFNANLSVQGGYAHFWYDEVGEAITGRVDADFAYFMTTFNY